MGWLAAGAADADDLEVVARRDEIRTSRRGLQPRFEAALAKLDHAVALGAHEVVVMRVAAEPVAGLAAAVRERVDDAVLDEAAERPVDGREADLLAVVA